MYSNGSVMLGSMQVVEDGVVCAIQLWWEVPLWLSFVEPKGVSNGLKVRVEGEAHAQPSEGMRR